MGDQPCGGWWGAGVHNDDTYMTPQGRPDFVALGPKTRSKDNNFQLTLLIGEVFDTLEVVVIVHIDELSVLTRAVIQSLNQTGPEVRTLPIALGPKKLPSVATSLT